MIRPGRHERRIAPDSIDCRENAPRSARCAGNTPLHVFTSSRHTFAPFSIDPGYFVTAANIASQNRAWNRTDFYYFWTETLSHKVGNGSLVFHREKRDRPSAPQLTSSGKSEKSAGKEVS